MGAVGAILPGQERRGSTSPRDIDIDIINNALRGHMSGRLTKFEDQVKTRPGDGWDHTARQVVAQWKTGPEVSGVTLYGSSDGQTFTKLHHREFATTTLLDDFLKTHGFTS